jgi:hypothetical protein
LLVVIADLDDQWGEALAKEFGLDAASTNWMRPAAGRAYR